jgi:hypothetical protein
MLKPHLSMSCGQPRNHILAATRPLKPRNDLEAMSWWIRDERPNRENLVKSQVEGLRSAQRLPLRCLGRPHTGWGLIMV